MESLALILIILGLLFVLVQSAKLIEETFVLLAKNLRINPFIIGFVVLSIITSLPEMSIAVVSSDSVPHLSVGNMIGASAILLTLIIGIGAIKFKKIQFKGKFSEKEVLIGLFSVALMLVSILDKYISVVEGIFMIAFYILYVLYLNYKFRTKYKHEHASINIKKLYNTLGKAALGVLFLIISSSLIVNAAESLAFNLQISPALIGLVLLAVGTNIPELTIMLTAKIKKEEEVLTVSNIIGSLCVNPGIVGLLAILSRGVVINDIVSLTPAITIAFAAVILFGIFSWSGRVLTRLEGFLLVGIYCSLLVTELIIITGVLN